MWAKIFLSWVIVSHHGITMGARIHNEKRVYLRKLGQCKDFMNTSLLFSNYVLHVGHDQNSYDMKVTNKAVIKDLEIWFTFQKCDAAGSLDSCEYTIKDLAIPDICSLILETDEIWSPFLAHFNKPIICPIQPGVYETKNSPLFAEFLDRLPLDDALWKLRMVGYDEGKLVTCVDIEEQILPYHKIRQRQQ